MPKRQPKERSDYERGVIDGLKWCSNLLSVSMNGWMNDPEYTEKHNLYHYGRVEEASDIHNDIEIRLMEEFPDA